MPILEIQYMPVWIILDMDVVSFFDHFNIISTSFLKGCTFVKCVFHFYDDLVLENHSVIIDIVIMNL